MGVGAKINEILRGYGLEIRRIRSGAPASRKRPVGQLRSTVEDLRARGFMPRHVVDVGANRGQWSRTALSVWPAACVYMFEPIGSFEEDIRAVAAARQGSRYWMAAAGATAGTIEINDVVAADGTATSGSTILATTHDDRYTIMRTTVPVVTLDQMVSAGDLPASPELVKIDVEGYELEVLKGAVTLFGETEVFILETSFYPFWGQPVFHEVVAYMADRDYLLYDFATFRRRPKDGALGQADVCFVRRRSILRRETAWHL